jgi:hypothetical protein
LQIVPPSLFSACVLEGGGCGGEGDRGGGGGRRDGAGQSAWKGYLEWGVCGCAWKCGSGSSSLDCTLPLAFVIVLFLQLSWDASKGTVAAVMTFLFLYTSILR